MLRLSDIDKSFGATRALSGVTVEAAPGTVLGLVGENGAGKSTLMKIAGGAIVADRGTLSLDGQPLAPRTTHRGAGAWHRQRVPGTDAAARPDGRAKPLSDRRAADPLGQHRSAALLRRKPSELLDAYELPVAPDARVADLPLGQQQMLEIVRAVARKPRVLLLDEATSALGATEVDWLHGLVRTLKDRRHHHALHLASLGRDRRLLRPRRGAAQWRAGRRRRAPASSARPKPFG